MQYQLESAAGIANRILNLVPVEKGTLFVGLDVEKEGAMITVSFNAGAPLILGKDTRENILAVFTEVISRGHTVICVQEACGFGYGFHRALDKAGVTSLVVAPETLNAKRKTDRMDSRKLCTKLLDFWVRGDKKQFKVVRPPTPEQERRRALWRQRSQLHKVRNMLVGHGRSLLQEHGYYIVPDRWWGPRIWARLIKRLDPWIISMLEAHRKLILDTCANIAALETRAVASEKIADGRRPYGLGECTRERLQAEVLDWNRFTNRRQVGSFIGCSPSECSSGGTRRQGSIDRIGNGRIRSMLVEAVWRLRLWNSSWRGIQKFHYVLGKGSKAGPAAKKKAVVACARLLAIDLWRIETGRIKPEDVGLKAI